MKILIVAAALLACAYADVSEIVGGYNYNQPQVVGAVGGVAGVGGVGGVVAGHGVSESYLPPVAQVASLGHAGVGVGSVGVADYGVGGVGVGHVGSVGLGGVGVGHVGSVGLGGVGVGPVASVGVADYGQGAVEQVVGGGYGGAVEGVGQVVSGGYGGAVGGVGVVGGYGAVGGVGAVSQEYIPPVHSAAVAPVAPVSNYLPASVGGSASYDSYEPAQADGYRYKTVRRLVYKHRQ